jgi:hypothetical protein
MKLQFERDFYAVPHMAPFHDLSISLEHAICGKFSFGEQDDGVRPNLAFQLMHILTPLSGNVAVHGQHLLVSSHQNLGFAPSPENLARNEILGHTALPQRLLGHLLPES